MQSTSSSSLLSSSSSQLCWRRDHFSTAKRPDLKAFCEESLRNCVCTFGKRQKVRRKKNRDRCSSPMALLKSKETEGRTQRASTTMVERKKGGDRNSSVMILFRSSKVSSSWCQEQTLSISLHLAPLPLVDCYIVQRDKNLSFPLQPGGLIIPFPVPRQHKWKQGSSSVE